LCGKRQEIFRLFPSAEDELEHVCGFLISKIAYKELLENMNFFFAKGNTKLLFKETFLECSKFIIYVECFWFKKFTNKIISFLSVDVSMFSSQVKRWKKIIKKLSISGFWIYY